MAQSIREVMTAGPRTARDAMSRLGKGLLSGAAGTAMLDTVTYLDMALRGRPPSPVPEQAVDVVAERAGVSLGSDADTASARRTAGGSLLGHLTGFAIGAAFGLLRPATRWLPRPLAIAAAGLGAMAATDAASAALGVTDPRSWGAQDWAADVVPHLAYGAGLVLTYDGLDHR